MKINVVEILPQPQQTGKVKRFLPTLLSNENALRTG